MQVKTNAEQVIQKAKFNKFHGTLLFWGALLMLFDGFDLTIYGAVVPTLIGTFLLCKQGCTEVMPYLG